MSKLMKSIRNLPPSLIEAVIKEYLSGKSIKEIAKYHGISLKLLKALEEYGDPSRGILPLREQLAQAIQLGCLLISFNSAKTVADRIKEVENIRSNLVEYLMESLKTKTINPRIQDYVSLIQTELALIEKLEALQEHGSVKLTVKTTETVKDGDRMQLLQLCAEGALPQQAQLTALAKYIEEQLVLNEKKEDVNE